MRLEDGGCPARQSGGGDPFCRRTIELEDESADAHAWVDRYRDPHRHFAALAAVNSGDDLFADWLARGFPDNWIGEPVTVLVRRASLRQVGPFNPHTPLTLDIDMWMRIIGHHDAAFVDEELVTYRHSAASTAARILERRGNWLDALWTLEWLGADKVLAARHPELNAMRRTRRRAAFRTVVRGVLQLPPDLRIAKDWAVYEAYRAKGALRR
jgi:hypothetical protein